MAAFYYCEHFDTIKNIMKLDKNYATSIEKVNNLIDDLELKIN